MRDWIKYSILITFLFFDVEQYLYAQEKTSGGRRENIKEEQPTNSSAYRGSSSDSLKESSNSFNKEEIIIEIKAQLAAMATKPLMELTGFCNKNAIQGEFVVDLTLIEKGKVLTVFMVSGGEDNIAKKNQLKNKLSELRFEKIKIPKKEKVKLRHILKF